MCVTLGGYASTCLGGLISRLSIYEHPSSMCVCTSTLCFKSSHLPYVPCVEGMREIPEMYHMCTPFLRAPRCRISTTGEGLLGVCVCMLSHPNGCSPQAKISIFKCVQGLHDCFFCGPETSILVSGSAPTLEDYTHRAHANQGVQNYSANQRL